MPKSNDSPGWSTRTSTSGASWRACSTKSRGGFTRYGQCRRCTPTGAKVPQWIGIASLGRIRRSARAAWSASMWPGPSTAPDGHRQDGHVDRAKSSHHREKVSIAREVDPLAAVEDEAEAAPNGPNGARNRVERPRRDDADGSDLSSVAGLHLADVAEATPLQKGAGRPWHQQTGRRARGSAAMARPDDRGACARSRRHRAVPVSTSRDIPRCRISAEIRWRRIGSVRMAAPSSSMSTVACPKNLIRHVELVTGAVSDAALGSSTPGTIPAPTGPVQRTPLRVQAVHRIWLLFVRTRSYNSSITAMNESVLVPERRVVALLLDQQRWHAGLGR